MTARTMSTGRRLRWTFTDGLTLVGRELRYGERVHLRFAHEPAPLAAQLWPPLRRLFLRHFSV